MKKGYKTVIKIFIITVFLTIFYTTSAPHDAFAHSLPISYSIEPNTAYKNTDQIPHELTMSFSERPDPKISYVHIIDSKDQRVDNDDFTVYGTYARDAKITIDNSKISNGIYTVTWLTMSADDGHIAKGSFIFAVGNITSNTLPTVPSSEESQSGVTSSLDGFVKWPLLVGQISIVGLIFSYLFSIRNKDQIDEKITRVSQKRLGKIIAYSSIAVIISSTLIILLQAHYLSSDNDIQYLVAFLSLLPNQVGQIWILRVATAAIIIGGITIMYKSSGITNNQRTHFIFYIIFATASINILSNSLVSHNAGVISFSQFAIFTDWLHIMAVSIWVGGLLYISLIQIPTILSFKQVNNSHAANYLVRLIPKFSLVAITSLGVIGISGLYMAWLHIENLHQLFNTPYGNILIIKLGLALPMILLGAYHQNIIHRKIVSSIQSERSESSFEIDRIIHRFRKTINIEIIIGLGVLLAASFLTITSPAFEQDETSQNSNQIGYSKTVKINGDDVRFAISPMRVGFNTFQITITDPNGKPDTNIHDVIMQFTNDEANIGPIIAYLNKTESGTYATTGGYMSQKGEWDISFTAQRNNAYDLNYIFALNATSSDMMMANMPGMEDNMNHASDQHVVQQAGDNSVLILASILSAMVATLCTIFFKRTQRQLQAINQT